MIIRGPDWRHSSLPHRILAFLQTGALALVAAAALAAPAQAGTPCWEEVVNDWFGDGRVDKIYPIDCYRQAIENLPQDAQIYSSAPDDIRRAMQQAVQGKLVDEGVVAGTVTGEDGAPVAPGDDGGDGGAGQGAGPGGPAGSDGGPDDGVIGDVLDKASPSNAGSVPLPLIILAAIAALLLAAASAGLIARRVQARRVSVGPLPPGAPRSERPPLNP